MEQKEYLTKIMKIVSVGKELHLNLQKDPNRFIEYCIRNKKGILNSLEETSIFSPKLMNNFEELTDYVEDYLSKNGYR